jgi:hypothetical protein
LLGSPCSQRFAQLSQRTRLDLASALGRQPERIKHQVDVMVGEPVLPFGGERGAALGRGVGLY